jgi:hypothetical protein
MCVCPGRPPTPAFALGDDADAGGDAGPVDAREPGEAARVIPLIVQHAATRAPGGSGDQASATRPAVRESHAGETIPVAE